MNFLTTLRDKNLDYVLSDQPFRAIIPHNGKEFANLLEKIVKGNLSVFIDKDCDPDGYFAYKALVDTFALLNFSNYKTTHHTIKRHSLSEAEITAIANDSYDVVFILDSSTNDMRAIQKITDSGAIVCIVDHHESHYMFNDYPDKAIIINPKIDKQYERICYDKLSAGAITAILCAFTLETMFSIKPPVDLYLYGVITLYSDIMDMNNAYNIAYISKFQNTQQIKSPLIKLFWDEKSHFDKSYISFKLIPRLNSLFRTESFEMLERLFDNITEYNLDALRKIIEDHYQECKHYTERLTAGCTITEYDNIVLAEMSEVYESYARNFTGLVASKVASTYNKPVVCLHRTTPTIWHGSVRDNLSRDLLSLFRPLCYAEGHDAAFGVQIPRRDSDTIMQSINTYLYTYAAGDDVIIIDWDKDPNYATDIQLMAEFNEFGGQALPTALGAITVKPNYKIYRNERCIMVYGDGQKFVCLVPTLAAGDKLFVKPTLNGSSYTNFVNTVHLS